MSTAQRPDPTESVRHQLRPLFDQIVIKELDSDRVRRSGLVVPPGSHEPPPQQGIVLAIGSGLDWWSHVGVEMPVQPGDHVVFPASAGVWSRSTRSACWSAASPRCSACSSPLPGPNHGCLRPGQSALSVRLIPL